MTHLDQIEFLQSTEFINGITAKYRETKSSLAFILSSPIAFCVGSNWIFEIYWINGITDKYSGHQRFPAFHSVISISLLH